MRSAFVYAIVIISDRCPTEARVRMLASRRCFLKHFVSVIPMALGGTHLAGCLGESNSESSPMPGPGTQSGSTPTAPTAATTQPTPSTPSQTSANSGPVWQSSPTIEFVEGVPAVVSVRDFVEDPDKDPVVIALKSGALLPGITWNPSNATIAYDGRPLGAKPNAAVVVTGITFSADDQKR